MSDLTSIALALLFVAVIAEGIVLVGVMRQVGALVLQIQPDMPRAVGGGPELETLINAEDLALASLQSGAVIAFLSPNCELCTVLHAPLQDLPIRSPELTTVVAIAYGSSDERLALARDLGSVARLDLEHLMKHWQIPGTPYVVSVDRSGRVRGKGVVNTTEQLDTMVELALLTSDGERGSLTSHGGAPRDDRTQLVGDGQKRPEDVAV